ncbi:MAG: ribonucleoside triphosphate reductase [Candidatus Thermoplasmatota archaeon]|jgi:ribonucleoside-triphosphate reductase|nr:ribonucleoside triphosphate reductase [Candidatus Thermoplasmatota archaeon]
MIRKIRKRDGKIVDFNPVRITEAIWKAAQAVGGKDYKRAAELTDQVLSILEKELKRGEIPTVEQVQDAVEKVLIEDGHAKTAKAFILYRKQHQDMREIGGLLKDIDVVDDYLSMLDWKVNENSNMSYSLQGLNVYATESIVSHYWLNKIYPPEIGDAHSRGDYHIHDLGTLGAYCVGWDLKDLLLLGFKGVSGKIESKPAKHFSTALMQIVNYLYTLQGEAAGAQALSNFDSLLAPFIAKDQLSYDSVKQEMQKFLFNMNVPTRVGFQSPFTNITMDLTVPSYMMEEPAIIGGNLMDNNYSEYTGEMDMINHAFAEIMHDGDAKGRPFTFPIPTYNITKDFNWNNDGLAPLWDMTAKYGIPYFSNFINSDMKPEDARSMCCRLRLDNRELQKRGGGLFGANPKTGSIGVVTLNMPRIGYLAKDDTDFFERLDKLMMLARQSLEIKRDLIENLTSSGLHPYSRYYLSDVQKTFGEYWKNHFSTIGLIGMNDALLNFMNKSIADPEGKAFAEKVLDYMRTRIMDYQEETGNIFNLEATPGEGTSYRLARLDKKYYPELRTYNQEIYSQNRGRDVQPYYTNSTQLPVGFTTDVFEALDLQDSLQTKYTGGTVLHIFLGEEEPSPTATKNLVRKVAENYALPYYTITPTFSVCPDHGYIAGEHQLCPTCQAAQKTTECEIYSRVVGYIRPVNQWNKGKQQEFRDRTTFDLREKVLVTA